ncbi:MAG: flagellar hook-associated protein 3 [Piscirickettsiaceae bacterium]|nr:MAG: flagellar hook-associated protein 3 [Piscirickettsiaceae bacterium]
MVDRISTSLSQQLGINAIILQQARLSEIQQQISLGKKILKPSDDPAGAVQVLDLNQSLSRLDQFQSNLNYAENRLTLSDGILQSVTNSMQRVRELAVQGFNATNTASDRASIAQEMFQRLDEVLALANTKDANGDYLYAGFKTQTQAFTGNSASGNFLYQGDQGQRLIQIGEGRTVSDGNSGAEIFFNIKDKNGNQEDIFTTLYDLATDLSSNRPAQEEAVITTATQPIDGETVTINGITYEFESAGGVALGNVAVVIGGTTGTTSGNLAAAINTEQGLGNTDVTATVVGSELTLLADNEGTGTINFSDGTAGDLAVTRGPSVPLYDHLDQIDTAIGRILDVRSQIGARLNVIDSQNEINQDFTLAIQETKSQVEDLDVAAAISEFNLQLVALEAAQQAFIRVQGLSLFDKL